MEIILFLIIGILLLNCIVRVLYSFMRFSINIIFLLILKFYFKIPFTSGILFIFCLSVCSLFLSLNYMLYYISKKIYAAKKQCKKYRENTDCLSLRKAVRTLFECNYIVFIINCYFAIFYAVSCSSLVSSLIFIMKISIILLIVGLIKKIIDCVSEKYYKMIIVEV